MRRRLATVVAVTLALAGADAGRAAAQADGLEYDVKAAFLLNFSRYVTWPEARLKPPFRICVLGENPFGRRLAAAISDEHWADGPMEVRQVSAVADGRACHLLYVPAAAADQFAAERRDLGHHAVLTVGEGAQFLADAGMIRLFLESNRVRFSINLAAAEAAGLQVSSRLLRLAREVVPPPSDR